MKEKSFLQKFVGTYKIMDMEMLVSLKGEDVLVAMFPGQPKTELVPYQGTEFKVKNLSGFNIEFKLDPSGGVISAEMVQPNGVFTTQRVK